MHFTHYGHYSNLVLRVENNTHLVSASDFVAPKFTISKRDKLVHSCQQNADVVAARFNAFDPGDFIPANYFSLAQSLARELSVLHSPILVHAFYLL